MTKVKCKIKSQIKNRVKVRVIKAPIVNSFELRRLILERNRAIML